MGKIRLDASCGFLGPETRGSLELRATRAQPALLRVTAVLCDGWEKH